MRSRTATFVFHEPATTEVRDDLGRRVQGADTTVEVDGSVRPPSATERSDSATVAYDAVAYIPADAPVTLTSSLWVEVISAPTTIQLGAYSVESWSGGRKIIRLDLRRIEARDGSHGHL